MTLRGYLDGIHRSEFYEESRRRNVRVVELVVRPGLVGGPLYHVYIHEIMRINGRPALIPDRLRDDNGDIRWRYKEACERADTAAGYLSGKGIEATVRQHLPYQHTGRVFRIDDYRGKKQITR